VLKRDLVLVIGLIAAVVVGTATSTSAMQPQSKSTESMHIKTSSKKKTNRIQRAGADVGRSTKKSGKAVAKSGSKTSKAVATSSKSVAKDSGEVAGAGAMAIGIGAKKTGGASAKVGRKVAHPSKHRSTSNVQ
jgi:hypothetical protein